MTFYIDIASSRCIVTTVHDMRSNLGESDGQWADSECEVGTIRDPLTSDVDRGVLDDFLLSFYFCWKGRGNLSSKSSVKIAQTVSRTGITIYSKEGK